MRRQKSEVPTMTAEQLFGSLSTTALPQPSVRAESRPAANYAPAGYDDSDDDEETYRKPRKNKRAVRRRRTAMVVGATLGVVGVIAPSAVVYAGNIGKDLLTVQNHAGIEDPGKGEVESVNMDVQPITLSTAETKVTGVKAKFSQSWNGLSFNEHTITRKMNVATKITLDPKVVKISYDPKSESLTYTVPEAALTTSVDIPTGEAETTDTSSSLTAGPIDALTGLAKQLGGTFGNDSATEVPLLGEVAKGSLKVDTMLEQVDDRYAVVMVDKQCTPLITQIPGFVTELETNVKEVVQGQILDTNTVNSDVTNKLSGLMSKKLPEVQKIVADATVVIDGGDKFTTTPDQDNIAALKKYEKSGLLDLSTTKKFECAVSKDVTLTRTTAGASK